MIGKCNVVIAGPGAGKTHNMVQNVLNVLPALDPNRFCAVITYTNAATDEIQSRLEKKVKIPNNLFIGTTHSFLYRFIIEPYASLLQNSPYSINIIDAVKLNYKPKNWFAKKASEAKRAEQLYEKGIITYDKVLEKSHEIILNKKVVSIVSNRLQYIFIDEYQDTRLYQHHIIKKIIKENSSTVYCIGDPLQSIFKFTYFSSQLKDEPRPENFEETPLVDFKNTYQTEVIRINHRSSHKIINFVNNFNIHFQQKPNPRTVCNKIPVYYIASTNKQEIITSVKYLQSKYQTKKDERDKIKTLFLSKEWKLFEDESKTNKINKLIKNSKARNRFYEISRVVLGLIGLKKSEVMMITDEISFRKFCFQVMQSLSSRSYHDDYHRENSIRKYFEKTFGVKLLKENRGKIKINDSISQVDSAKIYKDSDDYYSTIHSAKGLEASTVLVCARTLKELSKWIETDRKKLMEMDDDYRLGYVAFSRAKDLLCLSCLQSLNQTIQSRLSELNIEPFDPKSIIK